MLRAAQFCCFVIGLWASTTTSARAQGPHKKISAIPGPMLSQGTQQFETPDFKLTLVKSSQTVAALKPKGAGDFDFTPGDLLVERSRDGYYHLGDVDLRLRPGTSGEWKGYSTALARKPVAALPTSAQILAAAQRRTSHPHCLLIFRCKLQESGNLRAASSLCN